MTRRITVVAWPGPPLRWAPLLNRRRWHGCEVEYDTRDGVVYLRASTFDAPLDSPVRQWSHEELSRELVALYESVWARQEEG